MDTLNIVYYFNKDWITDDARFELFTARIQVHLAGEVGWRSEQCPICSGLRNISIHPLPQ